MQKSEGLPVSTVIKNKWKIQGKIGQGSFGEIYAAVDLYSGDDVAIKVEKLDTKKMVLKLEVIALKKLQSCPYVVRYIHSGRQDDFNFLVMERLGENLADIRKRTPRGCFSLCTTLKLGIQMIDALEGVHKLGYIHRDIKPSNFVVGRVKKDTIYLIDFGLARKYRLPSGEIRPPRKSAGFRGTARYASINSHHSKELGRRDDLWCVFYVLVEFALGSLPWRKVKDKEHIGELKERYTNAELVKDLPAEFLQFMQVFFYNCIFLMNS
jgi:tau tubulin kinase